MSNANAVRAKTRAKSNPRASSEKAAIAHKRGADQRSVEAKWMRRNGSSISEIMRALNVTRRTVYNLLGRRYDSPTQQRLV